MKTVQEVIYDILSNDDGTLRDLLQRIVDWEKANPPKTEYDGFYWHNVSGDPRVLNKLVILRVLKVVMRTNSGTAYRVVDLPSVEDALSRFTGTEPAVKKEVEIPNDLLDIVLGHEEKKEVIMRALKSKDKCHLLLFGSPASAKSLILECLSRLPESKFVIGSASTKSGLFELLYNEEPKFLLLDEIDKIQYTEDLSILLSLMESGKIVETKFGRRREKVLDTKVIAACNRIDRLPPELLSRFIKLRFKDYSDDEFLEISTKVLNKKLNISESLGIYISTMVLERLKSRDVRDALKVARLLKEKTKDDVDKVIGILAKQQ